MKSSFYAKLSSILAKSVSKNKKKMTFEIQLKDKF